MTAARRKPARRKPVRRKPATSKGASVKKPVQGCPLKPEKPCDVDKLTVAAFGVKKVGAHGASFKRLLATTHRRRGAPVRGAPVPRDVRRLLRRYEFIIDIIASPNARGAATQARVVASAHYHGRKCATQSHAYLSLKAGGRAPERPIVKRAPGKTPLSADTKYYARTSFVDRNLSQGSDSAVDNATDLFGLVGALLQSTATKDINIQARGCGIRARGDARRANKALAGLVRIHRDSKWSITIKVPPFGKLKVEGEKGKETSADLEVRRRLRDFKGLDVELKHNDTSVSVVEMISKLKEQIQKIVGAITGISDFFKKMPQIGWKFEFELSVLTGSVTFEWWPEYITKARANGRYLPVQNRLTASIAVELVTLVLKASFGIDARAMDSGIVVKVSGSITLKSTLKATIDLSMNKPKHVVEIGPSADVNLKAVGYASLFGKTLGEAVLSADAGVELKGRLTIDLAKRSCKLTGDLKSKDIKLTGHISIPWWPDKKINPPIVILKERTLYRFR